MNRGDENDLEHGSDCRPIIKSICRRLYQGAIRQAGLAFVPALMALAAGFSPVDAHKETPHPGETTSPASLGPGSGDHPLGWTGLEKVEIPPDSVLPDLQTLPITDIRLVSNAETGERLLRFTNRLINAGPGRLELRGEQDPQSETIHVVQQIETSQEELEVPLDDAFYYDSRHAHFHLEGFTAYEIWTVSEPRRLNQRVGDSEKVGFCLYDTRRADQEWIEENVEPGIDVPDYRVYQTCVISRQGLSTGWMDVYLYNLPGQALNITGLEDGLYALRSTVDPNGSIRDANPDNNTVVAYFVLKGDELTVLEARLSQSDYYAPQAEEKLKATTTLP